MAKKEKTVDLKPRAEKISQEHLEALQKVVNNINSIQFNVGKLEAQKFNLMNQLGNTQARISAFQSVLTEKYGTFDVNIEDGTINWPEKDEEKEGDEK